MDCMVFIRREIILQSWSSNQIRGEHQLRIHCCIQTELQRVWGRVTVLDSRQGLSGRTASFWLPVYIKKEKRGMAPRANYMTATRATLQLLLWLQESNQTCQVRARTYILWYSPKKKEKKKKKQQLRTQSDWSSCWLWSVHWCSSLTHKMGHASTIPSDLATCTEREKGRKR